LLPPSSLSHSSIYVQLKSRRTEKKKRDVVPLTTMSPAELLNVAAVIWFN
ncbi:unnamed protein product, partial [Arabidopsis halleri]